VDIRRNGQDITMTLTREQLYQIYEDLEQLMMLGKGKREVTPKISEEIKEFLMKEEMFRL
jgi:hypothetical protein